MHRHLRNLLVSSSILLATSHVSAQALTHGQMIGELRHDGGVVWGRASAPCLASVQWATNATMIGASESAQTTALAARDNTVRLPIDGLIPDTRYYYRLRLAAAPGTPGNLGPIGTFVTAPAPTTSAPLRFAFSGDAQTLSQFDIFDAIAAADPLFFVSLGDYPYCDGAATRSDYWAAHQAVRSSPQWQAFTLQVPVIATWDDHEVANNWDANMSTTLVQNGTAAFRDWWPIADGPNDIWRRLRFGADAELFVLDTRRYRGTNDALPSPNKSCLGPTQLAWLQQALLDTSATWKFVATSVPTFYGGTDSWDGYVHEREQLLAFLRDQHVDNVVFLAADQHLGAVRELREGLLEVQAGPLAQFLGGGQFQREPEQRWHGIARNFAVVEIDPGTSPSTLRVRYLNQGGTLLHQHTTRAIDTAATLHYRSDVPEGAFRLADGPHLTRDEGSTAHRDRLHHGQFRLVHRDLPYGDGAPASFDLTVPPGGDCRIAADYEDVPDAAHPVLLAESFDVGFGALPPAWTTVDLGTDVPSAWLVVDGALSQRSNIGGTGSPTWLGSVAFAGSPGWTDYTYTLNFRSQDNDTCGPVFRFQNPLNFYRVRLDNERLAAQLTSITNGTATVLAEITGSPGFATSHWHTVTVAAIGDHLRVWRNGELLFDVHDQSHPNGKVGVFTWADQIVSFDDVVVRQGDTTGRTRQQHLAIDFAGGMPAGVTIVDQASTSGPSQWSVVDGELRQDSNINDNDGTIQALPKRGTVLLLPPTPPDQELRLRVRSDDNDALGVVLRYQDEQNYYRFSLDAERNYRRLVKVVQGQWTLLWEGRDDYLPGIWHQLQVSVRGDRLRVMFDGQALCDVRDASLGQGRCGLYTWACQATTFDDVVVQTPPRSRAVTIAVATGQQDVLHLVAPESAGDTYLLALSLSRTPGFPMAQLQPGDPRVWELTDDPFFQLSLTPNPFLVQFLGALDADGRADATIVWPALASQLFGGLGLYAGGITFDPQTGVFGELLPTVPVSVPR